MRKPDGACQLSSSAGHTNTPPIGTLSSSQPVSSNLPATSGVANPAHVQQTVDTNIATTITQNSAPPARGASVSNGTPPVITLDSTAESVPSSKKADRTDSSVEILETVNNKAAAQKKVSLGSACEEIARLNFSDEDSSDEEEFSTRQPNPMR